MPPFTIIIPCYNEEKRLNQREILTFLNTEPNIQILFVNDGSTDNTKDVLGNIKSCEPEKIKIINLGTRNGKAEAVRIGLIRSCELGISEYHGFLDADLSVSLNELLRLFKIITSTDKKFIFGSRIKKLGSTIIRSEWRHFFGRTIATFVGFITRLEIYDTQCSAKIFVTEIAKVVCSEPFKTRWLFDVEIAARINKAFGSLSIGTEEPLLYWNEKKGSKLHWTHVFQIFRELLFIYKSYRGK